MRNANGQILNFVPAELTNISLTASLQAWPPLLLLLVMDPIFVYDFLLFPIFREIVKSLFANWLLYKMDL